MWLFQLSGLSQRKQNTLEGSFKKRIVDVLGHGRQTGEKYLVSHAYCQKLGTNHSAVICEAVVFTIQTARRSLKFGTQRFEDVIIPTKLPREDELSSRGKVKVPSWAKRRSLPC